MHATRIAIAHGVHELEFFITLLWPRRTPARCQNRATQDPVDLRLKSTIKTDVWVTVVKPARRCAGGVCAG